MSRRGMSGERRGTASDKWELRACNGAATAMGLVLGLPSVKCASRVSRTRLRWLGAEDASVDKGSQPPIATFLVVFVVIGR